MNDLFGRQIDVPKARASSLRKIHSRFMQQVRLWHLQHEAQHGPFVPPPPPPPMQTIYLIGCGKTKRSHAAPAQDLYTGPLFRARRAWVERTGRPWFILSAKHGLIAPDCVIEPYDQKLSQQRRLANLWAAGIQQAVMERFPNGRLIVEIHAGRTYADPILEHGMYSYKFTVPFEHLGLGQQLRWYRTHPPIPAALSAI